MIPEFDPGSGYLPPGEYFATWKEILDRFGQNAERRKLLNGMKQALDSLKAAGCRTVYLDGSFVTAKQTPQDFDGCWEIEGVDFDRIDPILLTFDKGRMTQKAKYLGELFLANSPADGNGTLFREFFQTDRDDNPKGIIVIDLEMLE